MLDDRPTNVDLGRAVVLLREERGWSREELAALAGFHPTSVGRIERGEVRPRWDKVTALSFGLGIPVEDLAAYATRECLRRQTPGGHAPR